MILLMLERNRMLVKGDGKTKSGMIMVLYTTTQEANSCAENLRFDH
jgi:hypothetical protein